MYYSFFCVCVLLTSIYNLETFLILALTVIRFEALKAAGEVLSPTQLQEMEGALSSIPSLPGASEHCLGEPLPSPDELKALEDELEILTQRKNMIK